MMRRGRQDYGVSEALEGRAGCLSDQMQDYVHFLRTQTKQLGAQIDFEFERASELIFSLYKHLYSPSQCEGEKATLLNKLASYGVQWNIPSQFEARTEEPQVRSEEARSNVAPAYTDNKDIENNKRAYNMRVKNKPQKYRYGEDEYDYAEKPQRTDPPRRGRPTKRDPQETRREQTNPYEKAHYRKRRPYVGDAELKEESPLREEPGRSSGKWDSDEEKEENGAESLKNIPSEGMEVEKDIHQQQPSDHRGDVGVSPLNGQGFDPNQAPFSQLVEAYRRLIFTPKLILSLDSAE